MKSLVQTLLPEFEPVSLGGTTRCKLDVNLRRYFGVVLRAIGVGASSGTLNFWDAVEYVTVLQNGKQKMILYPTLSLILDQFLNYNNDQIPVDGFLVPFSRPGYPGSSWGTGDIETLSIECKIKAALSGGAASFSKVTGTQCYMPTDSPEPRGAVFLQKVIPQNPVAGWNTINDLPVDTLVAVARMIFNHTAITEVEIVLGEETRYHSDKWQAQAGIALNNMYKVRSTTEVFAAFLDVLGDPGNLLPLLDGGIRRPFQIRYYLDSTVAAASAFSILVEGVEAGDAKPAVKAA